MSLIEFPAPKWWGETTVDQFGAQLMEWEEKLQQNFDQITFDHDLLVPEGGTGGHSHCVCAYYCGEATCIQKFPHGLILCFFWTGQKDTDHSFYRFLPRSFLIFDKDGKETEISKTRRSLF